MKILYDEKQEEMPMKIKIPSILEGILCDWSVPAHQIFFPIQVSDCAGR